MARVFDFTPFRLLNFFFLGMGLGGILLVFVLTFSLSFLIHSHVQCYVTFHGDIGSSLLVSQSALEEFTLFHHHCYRVISPLDLDTPVELNGSFFILESGAARLLLID